MAQRLIGHRHVMALCLVVALLTQCKKKMAEIKFDLGKDVVETARASGVPRLRAQNAGGLIMYSAIPLPDGTAVHFTRPGYELTWSPVFSFSMHALEERQRQVHQVALQIHREPVATAGEMRPLIEETLSQFRKGKWKRYIPEWCPAVSGRSSLLDQAGELTIREACPADPEYVFSQEDWAYYAKGAHFPGWEWLGDGIHARLELGFVENTDSRLIVLSSLTFRVHGVEEQYLAANEAASDKEMEAKGVDVAGRKARDKLSSEAHVKLLEANALKRGDRIVER